MEENKNSIRIPRPKGTTQLARSGMIDLLHDRLIDSFFIGEFPFGGGGLDLFTFSSLYGVPVKKLRSKVSSNLSDHPLSEAGSLIDLRGALQRERLRMLGGVINRMGRADFETEKLLRYLGARVYSPGYVDPLMIKEVNSAITNQIRLSETELKSIALLNQTLDTIPVDIETSEAQLTREEALKYLSEIPRSPEDWSQELIDTPNLDPIPEAQRLKPVEDFNRLASHDYQKDLDIPSFEDYEDIPILPK